MALLSVVFFEIGKGSARKFSSSCCLRSYEKQGKMLSKMLSNRVDRKIQQAKSVPNAVKLLDVKRVAVLNKLYMRNISEALSFGGFEELNKFELQLTRVLVKATSTVEAYWTAGDSDDIIEVQKALDSIAGRIKNCIMYANMMGSMPNIIFKRDLAACHSEEVQKLLHQLSLQADLDGKEDEPTLVDETDASMKPMRMDTLGLSYDRILARIKDAKQSSYPLKINLPPTSEVFAVNAESTGHADAVEKAQIQQKQLRKFVALYKKSNLNSSRRLDAIQERRSNAIPECQSPLDNYSDRTGVWEDDVYSSDNFSHNHYEDEEFCNEKTK